MQMHKKELVFRARKKKFSLVESLYINNTNTITLHCWYFLKSNFITLYGYQTELIIFISLVVDKKL